MSKNRPNVEYSLFMSDPVPTKNNKTSGHNNADLFIKGNSNATFELKKGCDNIYIITLSSGNKKVEFNRGSFLVTLKDLKKYSNTPIKLLEDDQKESFTSVMDAVEMLYKIGKLYELIHSDIQSIFDDIKIVIPGTVAAYFIGCSSNDNFSGPMGCNPKCAASLAPGGKNPSDYICDDWVLMYESDGTFSALNQKISQHTYIHIGDFNFKGFTSDNIKQLTDANISSITLIYGKADGTYGEPTNSMSVSKLPLISEIQPQSQTSDSNNDSGAWILFIIIAIIIIILLIILYLSYSRQT